MGYTTKFTGKFTVTPALQPEHVAYLRKFSETRRMKRNPDLAAQLSNPERLAVELHVGVDGGYACGAGFGGQDHDRSMLSEILGGKKPKLTAALQLIEAEMDQLRKKRS